MAANGRSGCDWVKGIHGLRSLSRYDLTLRAESFSGDEVWRIKPGLDDQLCRLSPCRQSTADIIGEAFRRQTGDLNKYYCIQLSCGGGEFRVQRKQISFMCGPPT